MAGGTAARGGRGGLPRVVWVLAAGSFVNSSGSFVVSFLVLYLVHRGYGTGLAAWAVSAYAAGKMAAGPVGGLATDRLGPRVVTAASMVGSAAATLVLAAARAAADPGHCCADQPGVELYRPAASAILAADVPGQRRVQAFGVYQLGVNAGATAGPAIGGLVAEHSFLILFLADAATSLAWAIVAWCALPATRARSAENGLRPAGHGVLADRRLMRLLAMTVLVNLVLFQAQTTLPLWVHRQGLPTAAYSLLLALNSGLVVALQLPAARLAGRRRPESVIAGASVVIGAGFTLLAVAHTAVLLAAAVTVWSLGELAQWPVAAAYTTRLAPPGMTGRYAAPAASATAWRCCSPRWPDRPVRPEPGRLVGCMRRGRDLRRRGDRSGLCAATRPRAGTLPAPGQSAGNRHEHEHVPHRGIPGVGWQRAVAQLAAARACRCVLSRSTAARERCTSTRSSG